MDNEKKVFVSSYNGPFLNSDFLIVEFEDVLSIPEFNLLRILIDEKIDISHIYVTDNIYKLSTIEEKVKWYLNRKYIDTFMNLTPTDNLINNITKNLYPDIDDVSTRLMGFSNLFTEGELLNSPDILDIGGALNFMKTLSEIMKTSIVKNVIIFSKYHDDVCNILTGYIKKYVNENAEVTSCNDLGLLLKEKGVTNNSTYVFSDITHINTLKENNLLNKASILLVEGYEYNKNSNGSYKINIDLLHNDYIFKFDEFNNYFE